VPIPLVNVLDNCQVIQRFRYRRVGGRKEGEGGVQVRTRLFFTPFDSKHRRFAKTGSGQTDGKLKMGPGFSSAQARGLPLGGACD
jgi:hypothetical protein